VCLYDAILASSSRKVASDLRTSTLVKQFPHHTLFDQRRLLLHAFSLTGVYIYIYIYIYTYIYIYIYIYIHTLLVGLR